MVTLRPYQQTTLTSLYEWLRANEGDPCVVLPTASGKSIVIAAFIESAIKQYPTTRVLVLTHVKELIQQDFNELVKLWPNAPAGIYSAGLGRREVSRITFGGVQSLRGKASMLGSVNVCLVDEAHLISHKDEGGYRDLIKALREINPRMRVVGFTATPWRLGHGRIDEGDALFSELIEPTSIQELITQGYLSPLVSRATDAKYSTDGIHKRGGEYVEKELQLRVDTASQNQAVAKEIIALAGDRKAWLLFCTGVDHAYHMCDCLRELGITAETVTGKTPKIERDDILRRYKAGKVQAVTNAQVLTTGFNYPDIDLIALLRPTMSPGLYMQMIGRGFRLKSHTDHCLVLDFAGIIAQHGPVTAVAPPAKAGDGTGLPPSKECPECHWIVPASVRRCPNEKCGYEFPIERDPLVLRNDDIMGKLPAQQKVYAWRWEQKTSRAGNDMIVVSYYSDMASEPLREYLLIWNEDYAGIKGRATLSTICEQVGVDWTRYKKIEGFLENVRMTSPPTKIDWTWNGNYKRVINRIWENQHANL